MSQRQCRGKIYFQLRKAYLRPAMKRENFSVLSQTLTDKIIFEGTTAKGLKISNFKNGNETEEIFGEDAWYEPGENKSSSMVEAGTYENITVCELNVKPDTIH